MTNPTVYLLFIYLEIFILFAICVYLIALNFSFLKGAPYVPTGNKDIDTILAEANLKKGDYFLELGCGDGRVVRRAVQKYNVTGEGVDINPLWISFARLKAHFQHLTDLKFYVKNILDVNLANADALYIFLFPALTEKIQSKIEKELKNNAQIISHGFKITFLEKYLIKEIKTSKFSTFYYQIKK